MARKTRGRPGDREDEVLIGRIVKPHGLKGELKILAFSQCPENFKNYKRLSVVEPESGIRRQLTISQVRVREKLAIVKLAEISGRDEAEALQGFEVWLPESEFPELPTDEYYWHRLKGARVVTVEGHDLGTVSTLFSTKAHDILVVAGPEREYMIPVQGGIVVSIDERNKRLVVAPMEGLLELNE